MRKMYLLLIVALLAFSCENKPQPEPEKPSVPEAPAGLVLHGDATETSLTFQWDAVNGAKSYAWQLTQAGAVVKDGSVTSRNVRISDLAKATDYRFGVCAQNEAGASAYSWTNARTAGEETPVTPPAPVGMEYTEFQIPAAEEDGVARAFPGAEGGGMYTTGGRGGKVIHVTNLNDKGTGSLRAAIGEKGARTIVFDVSGLIELQSPLKIANGDVTIAGQTAPGDGICLKNYRMEVQADNVIIRFLHFRLGDQGANAGDSEDCVNARFVSNLIVDHCSMSWSIDECASFYANEHMTLQWCILTESMNDSAHSKGSHGYGGIWGGKDASFHHNLLSNHHSRNPRPDHPHIYPQNSDGSYDLSKRGNVDFRNLVIYNWGDNSTYGGEGGKFNLVNCYYKPGPDSRDRYYFVDAYSVYSSINYGYPQLYMDGNIHTQHDDISENNTVHGVYFHEAGSYSVPSDYSFRNAAWPISGPEGKPVYTTTHAAEEGKDAVLSWAGDRLHRDAVDQRAVDAVKTNKGKIINTPSDVGGWPQYKSETASAFPEWVGDPNAFTLDPQKRYTNLEMYLHYLVRDIVSGQNKNGTYTKF